MNIQFDVVSGSGSRKRGEAPVRRLVIVGNFSGRNSSEPSDETAVTLCNMYNVDPQNIDATIARIAPAISVSTGEQQIELGFSESDDFHADALYRKYPAFAEIRRLKDALNNPQTERDAAVIARSLLGIDDESNSVPSPQLVGQDGGSVSPGDDDPFASLLGRVSGGSGPVRNTLKRILDDAVSQSIVQQASSTAQSLSQQLDDWCQDALRELLRLPEFRDLESSWLSLRFLAERLDSDLEAELWIADIGNCDNSDNSDSGRWVPQLETNINRALAGDRPDLLVLLHDFSANPVSLHFLQELATVAGALGCHLVASADHTLAGVDADLQKAVALDKSHIAADSGDDWESLRKSAVATNVALAFPRLMVRQPYGSNSDPIESFDFEELGKRPRLDDFPWCHASILLAVVWLQLEAGHDSGLLVPDLPLVTYDDGGGQAIMPATEAYISESATEALLHKGLIPLLSKRGDTSVRIPRLQSIAVKPSAL